MMLTPEHSMAIQGSIGADIVMVLDDVVSATLPDKARVEEATHRTLRWLDRCIASQPYPERQALFAIVQGGLHKDLRQLSLEETVKRNTPGIAIGGLSGGEAKDKFWRVVDQCTDPEGPMPKDRPRYVMGVGYLLDILCCVALGADMFDCVYPTRTARFGTALVRGGQLRLTKKTTDTQTIDPCCQCSTCRLGQGYSRAYLALGVSRGEGVAGKLITVHNLHFMESMLAEMRHAIEEGAFNSYCRQFLNSYYPPGSGVRPPQWCVECLEKAGLQGLRAGYDWENDVEGADMPQVKL
jgi:queuine tRNA-ribosyltransferase